MSLFHYVSNIAIAICSFSPSKDCYIWKTPLTCIFTCLSSKFPTVKWHLSLIALRKSNTGNTQAKIVIIGYEQDGHTGLIDLLQNQYLLRHHR